jgi:NTP pyrophosphatase (non-canonical NTP hydrolase)
VIDEPKKQELAKELGDVLWYVSQIASELELNLSDVANMNIEKLSSRKNREQLSGSGDNR